MSQKFFKIDEFKQKAIKSNLNIGYEILDMFHTSPNSTLFDEFVFIFKYKEVPLTFTIWITNAEFDKICKNDNCENLKEVIKEFEDLCLLQYRNKTYGNKFKEFITKQLINKHIDIWKPLYVSKTDIEVFERQVELLIDKITKEEKLPMAFYDLYKKCLLYFHPSRTNQ